MSQKKLIEIKALIEGADASLQQARAILANLVGEEDKSLVKRAEARGAVSETEAGQVIEGVFDGQGMIGPDGKQYSIAANYASKSKLVEGDMLKLTIDGRGNFIYKQIGPIDRIRIKGNLVQDERTQEWRVLADGKAYKVLLASVTYFKGEASDAAVVIVPKDKSSTWAAIENVIKAGAPSPAIMSQPINNNQELSEPTKAEPKLDETKAATPEPKDNDIAPLGEEALSSDIASAEISDESKQSDELKLIGADDEFGSI